MNDIEKLQKDYGGYWGEHPDHIVSNWQYEVDAGNTRQGYWEWVLNQIEGE